MFRKERGRFQLSLKKFHPPPPALNTTHTSHGLFAGGVLDCCRVSNLPFVAFVLGVPDSASSRRSRWAKMRIGSSPACWSPPG